MSSTLKAAALEFLGHRRIAVAGVSRDQPNAANAIYRKLRAGGYQVFAVNPTADEVEGDHCYRSLAAIGERVDGVVVGTPPAAARAVVEECAALGVPRVWLHRSIGEGSHSTEAVQYCHDHGIAVLDGACPMMFVEPVDFGHKCMCWVLDRMGKLPEGYSA